MLLTLDAGSGRQRPRDDDDSVVVSCGRSGQHGGDGVTRPSSATVLGQLVVAAAGRIHVEVRVVTTAQLVGVGSKHRTPAAPSMLDGRVSNSTVPVDGE